MLIFKNINNSHIYHYSDSGMKIKQVETGIIYDDAIDVLPCRYTYEETNEPIQFPEIFENEVI